MADQTTAKRLAVEHCHRITARDLTGLLSLYAADVRFEDPVGSGVQSGLAALRTHAGRAIAVGVREYPGIPVGSVGGLEAALPVVGFLPYRAGSPLAAPVPMPADPAGRMLRMDYVMVVRVDRTGRIEEMRSYWDPADMVLADPAEVPHAG